MWCQAEKEPDTALATDLPGTVDYNVFNSETILRLSTVSFCKSNDLYLSYNYRLGERML